MKPLVFIACALTSLVGFVAAVDVEGERLTMDDAIKRAKKSLTIGEMLDDIMIDDKTVLVELDMLFPAEIYLNMNKEKIEFDKDNRTKRQAVRNSYYRWTNGEVPYEISREMSRRDVQEIQAAIDDYHKHTCLRFRPATRRDRNSVRFQDGDGCSSYVGMIGGQQIISLGEGCRYKDIIIHEMGHAVGLQHEQTRPDRDNYVSVQTWNVEPRMLFNFDKYTLSQVHDYGLEYDYKSVMHYGQYAFSRNNRPTMIARDPAYQNAMGNQQGFSQKDINIIRAMYNCRN